MIEDYLKNKSYASNVEKMLRSKTRINLKDSFNYMEFMNEFKAQEQVTNEPGVKNQPSQQYIRIKSSFLDQLSQAEEKAALSGKFNPDELLPAKTEIQIKSRILSFIAANSNINTSSTLRWQLRRQKRIELLNRLINEQRLNTALDQQLPVTDLFGNLLREVLKRKDMLDLDRLNDDEIIVLASVLETLQDVDIPKPLLDEVKRLIKSPGLLEEYAEITKEFIGRTGELKKLTDFLQKKLKADNHDWNGIIITGMGGVGKSTLVGKFVEEVIQKKMATVAILDFDRPGLSLTDKFWLTTEVIRQVSKQYPSEKNNLDNAIVRLREHRDLIGLQQDSNPTRGGDAPFTDQLFALLETTLENVHAGKLPLLLVLDTFEEVVQEAEVEDLKSWLYSFADILYPIPLKVVLSGRLYDSQLKEFQKISKIDSTITINEFDEAIAVSYMQKLELSKIMIDKIIAAKLVPLRPLELKLTAKVLKKGKVSYASLNRELLQNKKKGNSPDLFTGIIYRRVLKRIKDKKIRAIAYPGLILRYITPEIVREVLQPALRLKPMSLSESTKIVSDLSKFNWLAYQEGEQVWHQKDLRRSMLRLMIADKVKATLRIRKYALKYFQNLHTKEGNAEVLYHQLMEVYSPEQGKDIELAALKQAFHYIQKDRADLPKAANTLLEFATRKKVPPHDLKLLPKRYFNSVYNDAGKSLLVKRDFTEAYALYKKGNKRNPVQSGSGTPDLLDNWEAETLFSVAAWKELARHKRPEIMSKEITITSVVNYMFPYVITTPSRIEPGMLEELLTITSFQDDILDKKTHVANQTIILSRLVTCLVFARQNSKLTNAAYKALRKIAGSLTKQATSPSLKKNIFTLSAIAKEKKYEYYFSDISTIRMDKEWLNDLMRLVPHEFKNTLFRAGQLFENRSYTWKQFITQFNKILAGKIFEWNKAKISLNKFSGREVSHLLRGPDTIFRDPCTYAVLETFKSQKDLNELSEIIYDSITLNLADVNPFTIKAFLSDNRKLALEHYIEIIDRCWQLGDFLKQLTRKKPGSVKIRNVYKAQQVYQLGLTNLFGRNSKRLF